METKPEQTEVHDISFEENTGRTIFAETKVAPKASDVFFAPQAEGMPFAEVLTQVQSYLSGTYATLITESGDEAKEQMKRRIARYLQDNRMAVDGMSQSELVDALYTEMAEYGFLTKYIFADGIEEIDINPGATLKSSIPTAAPSSWRNTSTPRTMRPMSSAVCSRTPVRCWTMPAPSSHPVLPRTSVFRSSRPRCWTRTRASRLLIRIVTPRI